jgi:hypothetical protein
MLFFATTNEEPKMNKRTLTKKKATIKDAYKEPSKLAMRIALQLFTPGHETEPVDHLKLYRGDRYVCGWGLLPAANAIQRELERL